MTVTLGIVSNGNIQGLLLCVSAALTGTRRPNSIVIRMEGELPSFGNFYLEQLAALAAFHGVSFCLYRSSARGIRTARQWQLDSCKTDALWMLDDDVLPTPLCLENLVRAWSQSEFQPRGLLGYVAGLKVDITNRRGYSI